MAGPALLLLPLLLALPIALVVLVALAATARPGRTLSAELATARRHGVVTSIVAVILQVAGLLLTPAFIETPALAAGFPLAGSAAALLALLIGELTWPRPTGTVRTALVRERSTSSLLQGRWFAVAVLSVAALAATLVVGGQLGRSGSGDSIATVEYGPEGAVAGRAASPFPGWDYGAPQLAVLAVVLGLLTLVLRAATHRAAVVTADPATDDLLRRASAARAFRTLIFGALVTTAADLIVGASAARNVYSGVQDTVAGLVLLLGALCGIAALAAVLVPAPRLPAVAPPAPTSPVSS
jgi:hypothetical protein